VGVVSGIPSGNICRVLFDEIYKGGDTFTQLENSCAEYGHQKEKSICSQDFSFLFSDDMTAVSSPGSGNGGNRGSISAAVISKEKPNPIP
jgi:hypothetical protein